jgi:nicotinate-nucleotide adenylyltransferase
MRLGIFGGSFDPVHLGHLLLAESCREQCGLDHVWFLPAAQAPHKKARKPTAAKHRLAMLELALAGHAAMTVSSLEIDRGGVSYTVETLRAVRDSQPDAQRFLLLGADSLGDLPSWYEAAEICQLATPVVVRRRPGAPEPDFDVLSPLLPPPRLAELRACQVVSPLIELDSSGIRQRVADGLSIRYRVPRAVEKYIETHGLYRDALGS